VITSKSTDPVDQEVPTNMVITEAEAEAAIELEDQITNPTTDLEVVMVRTLISAKIILKKIIKKEKILMKMYTKRNLKDIKTIKVPEVVVVVHITITSIIRMIGSSTERRIMRSIMKSHIKVVDRCLLPRTSN